MKIAIMQPYFIPYAGYFRLFCAADLFVVYDCVQFPRRGWVHRNQLYTENQTLDWLTLPLQKQAMDTTIKNLNFREQAQLEWTAMLNRLPVLHTIKNNFPDLFFTLMNLGDKPSSYIVNCLREICNILDIRFNISYSAELDIPKEIKGQERILTIAKHYGATDYINAPGGRDLYDDNIFLENGIRLHFLPEYQGEYCSILQYLSNHEPKYLKEMLFSQSVIEVKKGIDTHETQIG